MENNVAAAGNPKAFNTETSQERLWVEVVFGQRRSLIIIGRALLLIVVYDKSHLGIIVGKIL